MKKIFFLATILMAVTFNAQESDTQKLGKLLDVLKEKQDNKTVDSVAIELDKLKNTEDKAVQIMLPEAKALISDLRAENSNKVESKPISVLSKDDLKGFRLSDDKFKEVTYIEPKVMSSKYPYIAIKKGNLNLRYVMEYYGSGWIFWDKVIFLYDGKRFEYSDSNTDRSVSSGAYVTERSDIKCSPEMIEALREIGNSEKVEVRLSGKSVYDFELQKNSKEAIKKTIELYDKLKK